MQIQSYESGLYKHYRYRKSRSIVYTGIKGMMAISSIFTLELASYDLS